MSQDHRQTSLRVHRDEPITPVQDETYNFVVGRGITDQYCASLSKRFAEQLIAFDAGTNEALDLVAELAIQRSFLNDDLKRLAAVDTSDPQTDAGKATKIQLMAAARAQVEYSVDRVAALADKAANIRAKRRGRVDQVILASLAGRVGRSVDCALDAISPELQKAGITKHEVAKLIADELDKEAYSEAATIDGTIVGKVSDQPAEVTAEELMAAMLETVPIKDTGNVS